MDKTVKQITDKLYGEDDEPKRYRVWWAPQVPGSPFYYEVPDIEAGKLLTDALGKYDIFQYETKIKPDFANAGGIQVWDDKFGDWSDVAEWPDDADEDDK